MNSWRVIWGPFHEWFFHCTSNSMENCFQCKSIVGYHMITRDAAQLEWEQNDISISFKLQWENCLWNGSLVAYLKVDNLINLEKCLNLTVILKSAWFFILPWKWHTFLEKCLKMTWMTLKNKKITTRGPKRAHNLVKDISETTKLDLIFLLILLEPSTHWV